MIASFERMKSKLLLSTILLLALVPTSLFAAEFRALVGIPGLENITGEGGLNQYINALYRLSISIAALLAVIKIVVAGAKYMLDDIITHKEEAKKDIQGALIGLLIVIGAIIILNTINTDLTDVNFNLDTVEVDDAERVTPEDELDAVCADSCFTNLCSALGNMAKNSGLPADSSCQEHCAAYEDSYYYRPSNTMELTCTVSAASYYAALNAINEQLLTEHCPEGRECTVNACDESALEGSFTCETTCTQTGNNIGYYDSETTNCVRETITREQSCIADGNNWNSVNRSCYTDADLAADPEVCAGSTDCRVAACGYDQSDLNYGGCERWCAQDARLNDIGFTGGTYSPRYDVCFRR